LKEKDEFKAKFLRDVSFPDGTEVWAGQTLVKEWEFVNPEGAPRWPQGVKLIFQRGDRDLLGAQEEFSVPSAAPGEKVTVAVALPLPENLTGKKKAYFRLADAERNVFGDRCWVELDVKFAVLERKEQLPEKVLEAAPEVVAAVPVLAAVSVAAPVAAPIAAPVAAPVESKPSEPKPEQADELSVPQKHKAAMALLASMGFTSRDVNLYLLEKANGDIQRVVSWLLELRKAA